MAATIAPTASAMRSVMLSVLPRIVLAPVQGKRSRGHGVPAPGGRRRALTQTGAGSGAAVHPKGNSRFPNQETPLDAAPHGARSEPPTGLPPSQGLGESYDEMYQRSLRSLEK
jgi:hypothetical protein